MTLERAREIIGEQLAFGSGYNRNAVRLLLGEVQREHGLAAADRLILEFELEASPQDPIVLVAVTAAHRGEAFRACEFLIDYLKTRAPFWKKETTASGERWVEARAADGNAAQRWVRRIPVPSQIEI